MSSAVWTLQITKLNKSNIITLQIGFVIEITLTLLIYISVMQDHVSEKSCELSRCNYWLYGFDGQVFIFLNFCIVFFHNFLSF